VKGLTTWCSWPCCPHSFAMATSVELHTGLAGLIAMSTAASVWLRGTLALSTERENNEGSGNGDASVRKIDLDFC